MYIYIYIYIYMCVCVCACKHISVHRMYITKHICRISLYMHIYTYICRERERDREREREARIEGSTAKRSPMLTVEIQRESAAWGNCKAGGSGRDRNLGARKGGYWGLASLSISDPESCTSAA